MLGAGEEGIPGRGRGGRGRAAPWLGAGSCRAPCGGRCQDRNCAARGAGRRSRPLRRGEFKHAKEGTLN